MQLLFSKSPRVLPLKGAENFVRLMAQKPQATTLDAKIYVQKPADPSEQNHVFLGQIVPKKRFLLAVDRNRVRRVARAHFQNLAQTGAVAAPAQLLLKINVVKRKKSEAASDNPSVNPQSQAFASGLRSAMTLAVQRVQTQSSKPL